jgi:hypothetical protein
LIVTEVTKEPRDLDKLMEKIEEDNKLLAELDRKYKKVLLNNNSSSQLSSSLPSLASHQHDKDSSLNDYNSVQSKSDYHHYQAHLVMLCVEELKK